MSRTLAEIAADQALIYRQVDNGTWFRDRIASHCADGAHELADQVLAIAKSHRIDVPCGAQRDPAKVAA